MPDTWKPALDTAAQPTRRVDEIIIGERVRRDMGDVGALADSMAERYWLVYEAAFRRLGARPGERLFEVGFGNGKLVPRPLGLTPKLTHAGIDFFRDDGRRGRGLHSTPNRWRDCHRPTCLGGGNPVR